MAAEHLRTLQLEASQVQTAADFFESYATYIMRQASAESGDEVALADAATALRIAGQWAMLLDPSRAATLLVRSAEIWNRMQYGFGTFLVAALTPDQLDRDEITRRLAVLTRQYDPRLATQLSPAGAERTRADREPRTPPPLLHPQQQGYLFLAGAAMCLRMQLPVEPLRAIAELSPHRRGVAPMGALGTPLRVYWHIATLFLARDDEQTAAQVADDLAAMATSYAQTIDSAMTNRRLWFSAAAPVDVGDLDIAAIALAAAHRLGPDMTKEHIQIAAQTLDPTARVPLELANEMIDVSSSGDADQPNDRDL